MKVNHRNLYYAVSRNRCRQVAFYGNIKPTAFSYPRARLLGSELRRMHNGDVDRVFS